MRKYLAVVLFVAFATDALAQQDAQPVIETTLERTEAIPGQMMSLRVTIMVPTFMPKPPVWPGYEVPNLLVLLPERSTNPISKKIGTQTWSGLTRNYRISPMLAGQYVLPPQEVIITYADPETSDPVTASLMTDAVRMTGVIPDNATGLDPFIAAESLELKQQIQGSPEAMKPGDSITRVTVASVDGVLPMFLPNLLPEIRIDGIAAYADEPVLEDRINRDTYGGTRTERVTLLAEGGTSGSVPDISLNWYNLKSGKVETASVDGFAISVDGPPAARTEPRDWTALILAMLGVVMISIAAVWILRRMIPPVTEWSRARRAAWLQSEEYAYRRLRRAAGSRNYALLLPALDSWAEKVSGPDPRKNPELHKALTELGKLRYGKNARNNAPEAWKELDRSLRSLRHATPNRHRGTEILPPLNRVM